MEKYSKDGCSENHMPYTVNAYHKWKIIVCLGSSLESLKKLVYCFSHYQAL